MRYIVHDKERIIEGFEGNGSYTVTYPPYTTSAVIVDDNDWQSLLRNPNAYVYVEGNVTSVNT